MDVRELLAANVRRIRKAKGLTQEQLAEKCGMHRTYIGNVEQARVNASVQSVGKIADALGVTPARLLEDGHAGLLELRRGNARNNLVVELDRMRGESAQYAALADMAIEEEKSAAHEGKDIDW